MTDNPRILVLGYGEMGHAMQFLLAERYALDIWDIAVKDGVNVELLEDAVPHVDVVLFCLPVNPHRQICQRIAPLLKPHSICLSIAKGLDEDGHTAAEIFADTLAPQHRYALLYGPMISEEICLGRYAFAQLGSSDAAIFPLIQQLFAATKLYLTEYDDIPGISWSVILKNVYAMAFGMADKLELGDNMRGYLAVAALHELDQIVQSMGGRVGTPYKLAGLGDLMTTATSEDSHHHELGRKLASGDTEHIQGEGVHTLQMVYKHHLFDTSAYPLFELVNQIVKQPVDVVGLFENYLQAVFKPS